METRFHRLCVCFQVILAYESIVLCMCSGNVLIGYERLSSFCICWQLGTVVLLYIPFTFVSVITLINIKQNNDNKNK